ncbi:MAG: hypothetical protein NTZ56_19610 [Acidobacteria bacterium]|nr:hypothetical protein [Acidobacteriota bacterium]
MLLAALLVLNLGPLEFGATPADEPLIGPERLRLTAQPTGGRLSAKFTAPAGDRWVRLLGTGTIRLNGTLIPTRAQDQATGSVALTPFLRRGENLLEAEDYSGPAELEITPRVYLSARRQGDTLSVTVENTLANACNVEVTAGKQAQNIYIPPESVTALDFSKIPEGPLEVRLLKFAEALEEGYTFHLLLP